MGNTSQINNQQNQNQNQNQSTMSIKTNQNLDRLNKLSSRLTDIHV